MAVKITNISDFMKHIESNDILDCHFSLHVGVKVVDFCVYRVL